MLHSRSEKGGGEDKWKKGRSRGRRTEGNKGGMNEKRRNEEGEVGDK